MDQLSDINITTIFILIMFGVFLKAIFDFFRIDQSSTYRDILSQKSLFKKELQKSELNRETSLLYLSDGVYEHKHKLIQMVYDFRSECETTIQLIGMLGTVSGMILYHIDLDLSDLSGTGFKNFERNFFLALVTTGLGIFFSLIYRAITPSFARRIDRSVSQS